MNQTMNTLLTHPHELSSPTHHNSPRTPPTPISHIRIPTLQTPTRSTRPPHPRHYTIRTSIELHRTTSLLYCPKTYTPCKSSPHKLSHNTTQPPPHDATTPMPHDTSLPYTQSTHQTITPQLQYRSTTHVCHTAQNYLPYHRTTTTPASPHGISINMPLTPDRYTHVAYRQHWHPPLPRTKYTFRQTRIKPDPSTHTKRTSGRIPPLPYPSHPCLSQVRHCLPSPHGSHRYSQRSTSDFSLRWLTCNTHHLPDHIRISTRVYPTSPVF